MRMSYTTGAATVEPVPVDGIAANEALGAEASALEAGAVSPALSATAAAAAAAALAACGGGGSSAAPVAAAVPVAPASVAISATSASRFLSQAAIGTNKAEITSLAAGGTTAWINAQLAMARPQKFWDFLIAGGYDAAGNVNTNNGFDPMVWSQLIGSADVLRQRVGLSLINQWVVSIDGMGSPWEPFIMAAYLDILWDNAFGNYRDIMEGVSTSVAMGYYLTFLGNTKANPATGSIPDENYARELMQLFTIGLYQLNIDGTPVTQNGQLVPTYSQDDVSQAARVWTGYVLANNDNSTPARMRLPMTINANTHETGAINFLGISIPAGHTGADARRLALDGLFANSSLPPFVSYQLIQHMVTSNPSPAYVSRVANVFVNNGSGVRGDMKSVIRAILTDAEARNDAQVDSLTFGKLREPVVRLVQWAKAFGVTSPTNLWPFGNTSSASTRLAEGVGHAPSVFNWFRPGYVPPGTTVAAKGLVAPEFQMVSEPSVIAYVNYMQTLIANGAGEARPDYASLTAIAADSAALLAELNLVLAANQISGNTIAQMRTAVDSIASTTPAGLNNRVYTAILLVMASAEYLIQR
jgi:uncharacterized protein (DUF1800 family)